MLCCQLRGGSAIARFRHLKTSSRFARAHTALLAKGCTRVTSPRDWLADPTKTRPRDDQNIGRQAPNNSPRLILVGELDSSGRASLTPNETHPVQKRKRDSKEPPFSSSPIRGECGFFWMSKAPKNCYRAESPFGFPMQTHGFSKATKKGSVEL